MKISLTDKKIYKNVVWLFVRLMLMSIINLVSVRFARGDSGLGLESYGIFNAVFGIVNLMGCLNTVLASASQRFFSVAMADSNHDSLKSQYNASLRISIRLSLLVFVVLETVGLWFVISKMNYPDSMFTEVMIIYQTSIFSFIAMLIQAPYLALVMAYEKMNIYAVISLSGAFLKLALALMLCLFDNHRLMIYGIGWMVVSIITSLWFFIYCKRHFPECEYDSKCITKNIRTMLSFSGWTLYGSVAGALMLQGSNLLLNTYVGPFANAAFAVSLQIYYAFVGLGTSVMSAVRPQMVMSYTEKNYKQTQRLFIISTGLVSLLLIVIIVPFQIFIPQILEIWLGNVDSMTITMSKIFVYFAAVMIISEPITIVMQASGKVKQYHLPVESIMVLGFPINWLLLSKGVNAAVVPFSLLLLAIAAYIVRVIIMSTVHSNVS